MSVATVMRVLVTLAIAIVTGLLGMSPASAHSDTFSSIPAAGSTVANVTQIQFTFAEPVQKNMGPEMVLQASGGVTVPTGAPTFDVTGATMTVPVSGGALANGSYAATYRVVSIDGHVASGVVNFTVAGSTSAAQARDVTAANPISSTVPTSEKLNDVPWLPIVLSVGAVCLLLSAVIAVIIRRRTGKF